MAQGTVYSNPETGEKIVIYKCENTWRGETNKFDVERKTKHGLKTQIFKWGFTKFIGYEDIG